MKKLLTLVLIFSSCLTIAQGLRGIVLDADDNSPLPFVNITINGGRIGAACDIDGKFTLPNYPLEKIEFLELSYVGYEKKRVTPPFGDNIVIHLKEENSQLEEVTVFPGENPAHRIIENAVKNRKNNNPENIPAFKYRTYSKFIVSIDKDSIDAHLDFEEGDTLSKIDSNTVELSNFLEDHHLFFSEQVSERTYLKPSRDNETILANRTSGFEAPLFSLFYTQMQSFSFYDDFITILGNQYLNPITPGSTSRYFFLLKDTTYNSATDTVFIISFRPKKHYKFQPMQGLLYINTSNWAVQNVIAKPYENDDIGVSIQQLYRKFGDHTWFPIQLNAELQFPKIEIGHIYPYGRIRTYLKDVSINPTLNKKDISRADITVSDNAVDKKNPYLIDYREDSLTTQEKGTYRFLDSVGEAHNINAKLKVLNALVRGYIPIYFIDLKLRNMFLLNFYEGFRFNLGLYTNDKVSKWFKIGGYIGYGFGDKQTKYGWDASIILDKSTNFNLIGGYQFDISESGQSEYLQDYNPGLLPQSFRRLKIRQWDEIIRYHVGFTYDAHPKLHGEFRFQRENRFTLGDYYYDLETGDASTFQNGFNYSEFIFSLKYLPNEKYAEGPGFGKLIFQRQYPLFHFQFTQGVKGIDLSQFNYSKIDIKLEHQLKFVRIGTFSISAETGMVLQDVPYSKLYTGRSNLAPFSDVAKRSQAIADPHSFETMRVNEFLMDQYIQILFRQGFNYALFRWKKFAPQLNIVHHMAWGNLRRPELHHNLSTKTLDKGYFESGLEINRIYRSNGTSMGVGFYYRYGPNSLLGFENNMALKLTLRSDFD